MVGMQPTVTSGISNCLLALNCKNLRSCSCFCYIEEEGLTGAGKGGLDITQMGVALSGSGRRMAQFESTGWVIT